MKSYYSDVVIVGAGLTGLCLAHYLRDTELDIVILEARDRLGGRILTNSIKDGGIEMGATWFNDQHTELLKLIQKLGLKTFDQELGKSAIYHPVSNSPHQVVALPQNQETSYRLAGGTISLIEALLPSIDQERVRLDRQVLSIEEEGEHLITNTNKETYISKLVVSTLPPNLFVNSVFISPELPSALKEIASNTHTWMGESIKVGLSFKSPFWNENGLSGTIFSNTGPVPEMYDHSNFEQTAFALKGFLNGAYHRIGKEERIESVLMQLRNYYGVQVEEYLTYHELLWMNEPFTYCSYEKEVFPHQNNGHQIFRPSYLHDRLIIAGTETASAFPGYMEGAVRSAQEAYSKLIAS